MGGGRYEPKRWSYQAEHGEALQHSVRNIAAAPTRRAGFYRRGWPAREAALGLEGWVELRSMAVGGRTFGQRPPEAALSPSGHISVSFLGLP